MAEKEERILVLKATEDDFIYKHFNGKGFIPRQEAIDMIAKSLCQSEGWPCKECRYGKDNAGCQTCLEVELYKQYAEAALNALLEGK